MVCTAQTCSGRSLHILEEQVLILWNVPMRRRLDWERGGAARLLEYAWCSKEETLQYTKVDSGFRCCIHPP